MLIASSSCSFSLICSRRSCLSTRKVSLYRFQSCTCNWTPRRSGVPFPPNTSGLLSQMRFSALLSRVSPARQPYSSSIFLINLAFVALDGFTATGALDTPRFLHTAFCASVDKAEDAEESSDESSELDIDLCGKSAPGPAAQHEGGEDFVDGRCSRCGRLPKLFLFSLPLL